MIKNIVLGFLLPLILVMVGLGVFVSLGRPDPPKVPGVGKDLASRIGVMTAAEVGRVHALSEFSETLDIPITGVVVPYRELTIGSEVAGRIVAKGPFVRSGNLVSAGQILYQIDPADFELAVERLSQRRDQERVSLEELEQEIANSERLLKVADEELALAEAEVARFATLKSGFASAAESDAALRRRLAALNQQVSIQNQIDSQRKRITRLQLAAAQAETELRQAQMDLERTTVTSPVAGRVVSDEVEVDSYVSKGAKLTLIEDIEKVEVACNVRMDQLYWILDQQGVSTDSIVNAADAARYELPQVPVKVRFELSGRQAITYEWEGHLDRYDGAGLDPQSRTVPLRVLVDDPDEFTINGKPADQSPLSGPRTLVRGMFVNVIVEARPATQLLLIPKLAVKPGNGSSRVWLFEANAQAIDEAVRRKSPVTQSTMDDSALDDDVSTSEAANNRKVEIDPADWQPGFLKVIDGIQLIGPLTVPVNSEVPQAEPEPQPLEVAQDSEADQEGRGTHEDTHQYFWICEASDGRLQPGDAVIVTPLPGIEDSDQYPLRVLRSQLE
ncbi:MAG: biotin/lipoyl-binding protein [Planctomycetales bacterium]|nr:biotin/lipoyl-binding protein [Planctomycetales bacterium]